MSEALLSDSEQEDASANATLLVSGITNSAYHQATTEMCRTT